MPRTGPPRRRWQRPFVAVAAVVVLSSGARWAQGGPGDASPLPAGASPADAPVPGGSSSAAPVALAPARDLARRVDEALAAVLAQRGSAPAAASSDGAFLRRATLDLTGTLPGVEEARAFLSDASPTKRERLLQRLLAGPEAAQHFASWYGRLLLGRANVDPRRREALETFLAAAWRDDLPYDRLVAALVEARGTIDEHGEAAYVGQFAGDTAALAGRTARLFLGVRIACAQCHDHPFDRWKQADFAGLAGFFARTRLEKIATPVDQANAVNGRAEQQARQLASALEKARAELVQSEAALEKSLAALGEAEKAYAPVLSQAKALNATAAKERAQVEPLKAVAAEARAAAVEAEARAAEKDLPEALKAAAREQAKVARDLAEQAALAEREALASVSTYEARATQALAAGQARKAALDKAAAEAAAATRRRDGLKAYVEGLPDLIARSERVRDAARRLAAALPDVYRGRFLAAATPVPAERYRVVDVPGKVTPRAPNPAKPAEGDGMPRTLDGTSVAAGLENAHLREAVAAWIVAPANPTFARAAVNRFAAQLWGRGLIEPVDDVGDGQHALSREALGALEADFVASGFDLKRLLLTLALSGPYQRAAAGGSGGAEEPFVRAPVRELQPEVLFRALTRALLPGLSGPDLAGLGAPDESLRGAASLFDDGEDRPATTPRGGMRAALWLQNGGPLAQALSGRSDALAARLAAADTPAPEALDAIFLAFLTRLPTEAERMAVLSALPALPGGGAAQALSAARAARQRVLEDLLWSLACSTEFLTNH